MIRLSNIKLSPVKNESIDSFENRAFLKTLKLLKLNKDDVLEFKVIKKSIDARKLHDIHIVFSVELVLDKNIENRCVVQNKNASFVTRTIFSPICEKIDLKSRPVVIGAGPAGLFCAYILALNGCKPIVVERGKAVENRTIDVNNFWEQGKLLENSNVLFGEGGAGTFSDGKLNTQIKDKDGRIEFVLNTFVKFGADRNIVYDSKPHIGTDRLIGIVKNMRNEIISLGGEFMFDTCMVDYKLKDGRLYSVICEQSSSNNNRLEIITDNLILCIGHSSRDTFRMLYNKNVNMESKNFAVGFRVMHNQEDINKSQYGDLHDYFGAAPYKLTYTASTGRGVFSFCNCPGGYVVNSSSVKGQLSINGMSYSDRASKSANSAIIIQVTPDDFSNEMDYPLAGIEYQEMIEMRAYERGNAAIPVQKFGDFEINNESKEASITKECIKGAYKYTNLRGILAEDMEKSFIEAMHSFGRKIEGFDDYDTLLAGIESRTSSPIRIVRDDKYLSNVCGIYPCGEGAGYAGGITSAAVDGTKVAMAVLYNNE